MGGIFELDDNTFEFSAIAFGRIGGQNIGVEPSEEMNNKLKEKGYDIDEVIDLLKQTRFRKFQYS